MVTQILVMIIIFTSKVKNNFLPLFRPPTQSSVSKARWAKTLWEHYKYTNSICVLYSWLLHVSTQSEKRRVEKKTCEERRVWENTLRDSAPFYSLPPVDICHSSQGVCGRQRSLGNLWKQRKSIRKSNHCQVHCFSKIIWIFIFISVRSTKNKVPIKDIE